MSPIRQRIPEFSSLRRQATCGACRFAPASSLLFGTLLLFCSGCTSLSDYVQNGFKVGPNYQKPPAPVASEWIDSKSKGVNVATVDLKSWWVTAFADPKLNSLVWTAYQQNLDLRSAGTRILAARAQRAIAVGNLMPQTQQATGDLSRNQTSINVANPLINPYFTDMSVGGNLAWEVDFWGRFRRGIEASTGDLDASIENYDDALVLLISEVAAAYVQIRVYQQRLKYVADNIAIQKDLTKHAENRLIGIGTKIDTAQMRSNLYDTLSQKEQYEIGLRQSNNALCVLLGIPVRDLLPELGDGPIPGWQTPPDAAVGMPADLLRRRPDLRRAERQVAAQSARIGVATADLYPRLSLVGALGYESQSFTNLFSPTSFIATIGPSLRWDVLNYGRLLNAIRVQDAVFQTAVVDYQNAVLRAGREVEDSLVLYLRSQTRTRQLIECEKEAKFAVEEVQRLSIDKNFDLNRAFVTSNFLTTEQDKLAQSRGDIALGLIGIYKALGGGWELRLPPAPVPAASPTQPQARNLPPPVVMLGPPNEENNNNPSAGQIITGVFAGR